MKVKGKIEGPHTPYSEWPSEFILQLVPLLISISVCHCGTYDGHKVPLPELQISISQRCDR